MDFPDRKRPAKTKIIIFTVIFRSRFTLRLWACPGLCASGRQGLPLSICSQIFKCVPGAKHLSRLRRPQL